MTVLGIETSTAVCAAGLFIEGKSEVECSVVESRIHSEKLLTLIREVVSDAGISLHDLHAIAVSIGPGSFTGLRIGLSTAKGLCYALERPLVIVPTFEAVAAASRDTHGEVSRIVVMVDAKKEEFYLGEYSVGDSGPEAVGPVTVIPFDNALSATWQVQETLFVTDKVDWVRNKLGGKAIVEDVQRCCRGSVVARLGYGKTIRKEFADVASVEPVYLKDFVVRTVHTTS
jgi:tRNA threonylcarbamoyladenosine biosynthesis protein TsaB